MFSYWLTVLHQSRDWLWRFVSETTYDVSGRTLNPAQLNGDSWKSIKTCDIKTFWAAEWCQCTVIYHIWTVLTATFVSCRKHIHRLCAVYVVHGVNSMCWCTACITWPCICQLYLTCSTDCDYSDIMLFVHAARRRSHSRSRERSRDGCRSESRESRRHSRHGDDSEKNRSHRSSSQRRKRSRSRWWKIFVSFSWGWWIWHRHWLSWHSVSPTAHKLPLFMAY